MVICLNIVRRIRSTHLCGKEDKIIPEGPELKISRDQLSKQLVGKYITKIDTTLSGRYGQKPFVGQEQLDIVLAWEHQLMIDSISVKGKFMYWTFVIDDKDVVDNNDMPIKMWLHCTYGMSGQWVIDQGTKHPVVTFTLSNGQRVTFNDPRHFGTIKFVYDPIAHENKLTSIGPDIFDLFATTTGTASFIKRLKCYPKKTLAEVLMNQSIVSGIGNYIKAEALYTAKLSPHRLVESVDDDSLGKLYFCAASIMTDSYNAGGATIRTYKNPDGTHGQYTFTLKVYGKSVDPEGNPVIREETRDGRITHWCPATQK